MSNAKSFSNNLVLQHYNYLFLNSLIDLCLEISSYQQREHLEDLIQPKFDLISCNSQHLPLNKLNYIMTICIKTDCVTSSALCGSCLSVHCLSLMSTVVLKVPESIVWAAGRYMFSITWVETRSHSFFCRIDSLRE